MMRTLTLLLSLTYLPFAKANLRVVCSLSSWNLPSFFLFSVSRLPAPVSLPADVYVFSSGFNPVLPVNATGEDLIDRLQLPDSLLSSEHLNRGGPDATAEYDERRLELIGAPPTTPNGSFLDGSKKPPDSLEQSFVTLLNAWTLAASTSGSTDATGADSPGEDSTPLQADRITRLTASRVDSEAAGTGTLFLERLRQEEWRFRSLGEFPIGGFLCGTSVATEADTETPFGATVNIPSVGSNNRAFRFLDCHSCGRLRSGRDRNPLSRAIAPGRFAFLFARRVTHRCHLGTKLTPPAQTPLVLVRRRFKRLEQPGFQLPRLPLVRSTPKRPGQEPSF
jgi:hypothetical protein